MLNFKLLFLPVIFVTNTCCAGTQLCTSLSPLVVSIFDAVANDDNTSAVLVHNRVKLLLQSRHDTDVYVSMLGTTQESYDTVDHGHLSAYLTACYTENNREIFTRLP